MNRRMAKKTQHETTYGRIRKMILFGELIPGQPVTILGLSEALDAGATPVREAIRRLTAEGALRVLENRRIEVPEMTIHRLRQIELIRLAVEPDLAAMAAQHPEQIQLDVLERWDMEVTRAIELGDIPTYLSANYQFHFSLYNVADALILQRTAESQWLQIGPSLRVVCGRFGTTNLADKHREALAALYEHNTEKVKQAISEDIAQGMNFVRQSLFTDGDQLP